MSEMNLNSIEAKWQKKWEKLKLFEAEPSKKNKFYLLFAYPTVSGSLHIGHFRSYTPPDIIARYKRLKGFNVMFPLGFHATGVDCLKILNETKENLEAACKKYSIDGEKAKKFKTSLDVDKYLEKGIVNSFAQAGLSLDYRTVTSTIDPHYNKFIQWQFRKLKEAGYLIQKDYLLPFCPGCNHPVSIDSAEADISKGSEATVLDYTLLKFKFGDKFLVAATLRPETVYGQTNLWVRPDIDYAIASVGKEKWIISESCIEKLKNQGKEIKILGKLSGKELIGKKALAPAVEKEIIILPGKFVDPEIGTGIVTSVPSDAPYDYIALENLKSDPEFGKLAGEIKLIPIIKQKGFGDFAGKEIVERMKIKEQADPRLEEATQIIYKAGFHTGIMNENCGPYAGLPVKEAKEKMRADLIRQGKADSFSDLSEEVVCRCKTKIILKLMRGQWFINYADENWKKIVKEHIAGMKTYPEEYKAELPGIIDWLKERPCVRRRGQGTAFPFDETWIIEALSDSTIYMAFFFVSKYINSGELKLKNLDDEFFDFIYLGKGNLKAVSEKCSVRPALIEKIRNEFLYWYPVDINSGGKEHKSVHFPFFIFHHTAIFKKEHWPRSVFLNWHLIVEGEKMSKSKGNVVFWKDAIEKYGVDPIRLYITVGTDTWKDFDWKKTEIEGYARHVLNFYNIVEDIAKAKAKNSAMETWLVSKFTQRFIEFEKQMENLQLKKAYEDLFFGCMKDLAWYSRKCKNYSKKVKDSVQRLLLYLSPVIPHVSEELYSLFGSKKCISELTLPEVDGKEADKASIEKEEKIEKSMEDIRHVLDIIKKQPKKIYLYVIPPELQAFKENEEFLKKEFSAEIKVFAVNDPQKIDPENKSAKARPGKPGIFVE